MTELTASAARNDNPYTPAVFGLLGGWFMLITALALGGVFSYGEGRLPSNILMAITLPVTLAVVAYASSQRFRDWALSLDMRHLVLLHSFRMVGLGFVFLYFHDKLPAMFALPAGIGDAMAAAGALLLGIALYDNHAGVSDRRIRTWNTFGLIDFIVAVSTGVMTRTGEILHTAGQPGSDIMSTFPLALVPGFFVPMYIITHLIIYAKLRNGMR